MRIGEESGGRGSSGSLVRDAMRLKNCGSIRHSVTGYGWLRL